MLEQPMDIPDNLRDPLKRMIGLLPKPLRGDEFKQKATLAFLKVGGERLSRHYIKIATLLYKDDLSTHKGLFGTRPAAPPPPVETTETAADVKTEAVSESDTKTNEAQPAEKAPATNEPVDDFYM